MLDIAEEIPGTNAESALLSFIANLSLTKKKQMSKDTAVFASYMLKRWGDIYYSEYYVLSSSVYFEYCIPFTEAEKGWGFS